MYEWHFYARRTGLYLYRYIEFTVPQGLASVYQLIYILHHGLVQSIYIALNRAQLRALTKICAILSAQSA